MNNPNDTKMYFRYSQNPYSKEEKKEKKKKPKKKPKKRKEKETKRKSERSPFLQWYFYINIKRKKKNKRKKLLYPISSPMVFLYIKKIILIGWVIDFNAMLMLNTTRVKGYKRRMQIEMKKAYLPTNHFIKYNYIVVSNKLYLFNWVLLVFNTTTKH